MVNQKLVDQVTAYVNENSWRARRSKHTRRIVHISLLYLNEPQNTHPFGLQSYIKACVEKELRKTEAGYIVRYILHWLLDVIIDLVIKWWLKNAR